MSSFIFIYLFKVKKKPTISGKPNNGIKIVENPPYLIASTQTVPSGWVIKLAGSALTLDEFEDIVDGMKGAGQITTLQ